MKKIIMENEEEEGMKNEIVMVINNVIIWNKNNDWNNETENSGESANNSKMKWQALITGAKQIAENEIMAEWMKRDK